MNQNFTHRKATISDLKAIVNLLLEDELGKLRESPELELDARYVDAFHRIDVDLNHYLMVLERGDQIVGTCHIRFWYKINCLFIFKIIQKSF